ncbi:YadA-like family protein [Psychrobacter fjordensis]|uniref:YadA-like family protein n=1 Tax=Psychrobacter fjordensis TaxID=664424 RepID=UPI00191973B4|nr:YadA-like family protein [Psychrobacter fjordensis]
MNRIYKVIWNEALSCFTAVGEYAKGRGKSSKSSVNANATINTISNLSSIHTLRLSAIGLGLLAAGFGMHANAVGTYFAGDDPAREIYTNPFYHQTLTIQGGETIIGSPNTKNISVTANKHDKSLTIKLDKTVDLGTDGSLKTGDTLVDHSGVKIVASNLVNTVMLGHSGLNNGNNKIINVDDGDITATSKDAVNGSQLNSLTNTVAANKTKYYSVDSNASGNLNNDGATGYNAMAMGGNAKATGSQTIAIGSSESGQQTMASGEQSIAIGANVVSRGGSSIAIGGDDLNLASIYNLDGTITDTTLNSGTVNTAFNEYAGRDLLDLSDPYTGNTESGGAASIAIGVKARTEGHLATAIGTHASASETASSAFGVASSATEKGALALGAGAQSATQNGVALGSKSIANVAGGAAGFVPIGTLLIDENAIIATKSVTLGAVSVGTGSEGGNRQIVNVAAGTSNSDAVNVAQLKGLQNGINSTLDKGMDFGGDTGTPINRKLGEQLIVKGGETDSAKLSNSNNIGVVDDGSDTLTLKLAKDVTGLDSVTTGNTLLNTAGVSFLGGSTVRLSSNGLNNGGNRITNVNDGEEPMDAVNVRQLAGVTETANRGWDISAQGNSATKSTVGPGDTVDFNSKNSNITVSKDTTSNDVSFELSNNLDLGHYGSVKMGSSSPFGLGPVTTVNKLGLKTGNALLNTTVSGLGIAVSSPLSTTLISSDGVNIIGGPSVTKSGGIDAANKKITNVEAGTTTLDAVNFGQLEDVSNVADSAIQNVITQIDSTDVKTLNKTDNTANFLTGDNIVLTAEDGGIKVATKNEVAFTSVTTGDTLLNTAGISFLGGSTVRLSSSGLNNGGNRITNVADGSALGDAVNISQLNSSSAAARTKVVKGTNVSSVDFSTNGVTGQDVYTVNANGVTTSAGSSAVTVTAGDKDTATNTTDYAVDLSESSKASLVKADSAIQTVITQIDGAEVKTLNQTDNTANFLTGDNIVLTAENGGIKVATADEVVFTSVTTGDTLLNTGGVSFLGGSTVRLSSSGLNNGGNKITNVDDGEEDTDAVNVGQLNATNSTVDLGLSFTGDDTAVVVNRKLGQTLTIQGGATELTENNIGVIADDEGNLNVRLAEDVMLGKNGSVRMENTVLNNAGITITDGPNQTITLSNEGLDNGNNRIIKVAEGIAPSDAVNFAQLTTTNNEIAKGIKIGDGNSDNDQQFALGDTINVTGDSNLTTIASETGVQVKLNNQLDLGDTGSMQVGNSIMSDAGFTFVNNGLGRMVSQVSLSSHGLDNGGNTIRNVGEGVLDTDAVNVGQLKEVTIALDQGWGVTAQGDIATMVKQGDALDLNSRDGNIKVSRTSVNDATAFAASTGLQDAAIPTNANDISFDLNPDIILDSVTTGDTIMNDNGLTIAGGPSITKSGIDAANNKVTNVQNGEVTAGSQDAINGSQLYAQGSGISSIIGGDTVYDSESGTFTNSNIGGTGEGNIDGAIASIRQGTIEVNENVQVNTTNIATNTTNISTNTTNIATNTSNITTNTNDIAINTSNIMTTTTNIKTNTDKLDAGLNFGADSGANINKPVGDGSVLSFTGGNNITTTAEGSSIKFDLNGNISVDSVTVGTTVINSSGISMQDGPSMTAQGLYAGNQRITGVADGVEATDAVNYSQLSALDSRLNNNMSDLGYKIGEVEENANAGISAAMAMSSLPQAYIAGKSMISGGVGTYNGESAVAVGFSKLSNDGRWVMKINGTADTQGNAGGAIGAGFHFD